MRRQARVANVENDFTNKMEKNVPHEINCRSSETGRSRRKMGNGETRRGSERSERGSWGAVEEAVTIGYRFELLPKVT
ncbi:hypothetical protein MRX96_044060 [Rhipicephalus microplus]